MRSDRQLQGSHSIPAADWRREQARRHATSAVFVTWSCRRLAKLRATTSRQRRCLLARRPDGILYGVRIGFPVAYRLGYHPERSRTPGYAKTGLSR